MAECPHEIGVHRRHRIVAVLPGELPAERRFLRDRVVEFGVGVREFHPGHVHLESLGQLRRLALPLREWAERGRVIVNENRLVALCQLRLDAMLEQFLNEHLVFLRRRDLRLVVAQLERDFELGRLGLHAVAIEQFHTRRLLEHVRVLHPRPRRSEVDDPFAVAARLTAPEAIDARHEHLLREVHHREQVAISVVQLEHREFGIVPPTDALVAEDAADLVDLFQPADEQPLQR